MLTLGKNMFYRKAMESIGRKVRHLDVLSILNTMILIVLIVFVLICVRGLITRGYDSKDKKTPAPFQALGPEYVKKGLMEYESILINNPFGFTAGSLKPLGGSTDKSLPASDMKLIGTISGDDMFSYAVFVGSDGKQEIFKSGEFIPGTGLLKQVDKNKVYIENEDIVSEIPIVEALAMDQNAAPLNNEMPYDIKKLDKGEYVINQNMVKEALDNPGQFLSKARLIPNMKNNRQEGFVLREVKNGGIHDLLGLKNDDILMRVNDYDITNPENALRAFTALKGTNRVRLDIIRSGKRTTMTYQIR